MLGEASDSLGQEGTGADPAVIAALALGWEMSDLYARPRGAAQLLAPPGELPGIDGLSAQQRCELAMTKISALIGQLLGSVSGEPLPSVATLREVAASDDGAWRRAVYDLHLELLRRLEARAGSLSGAYDLGRALAETSRDPEDLGRLLDRLEPARLLSIEGHLADLSSRLPRHSAAAVAATLEQWKEWTSDARAKESMEDVRGALSRQRSLWRSLLTGEKEARQMLDPDTLVAASVRHASRLGTLIRGLTGAYLPVLAALVLSVALLLWTIVDQSPIATVIGALGALAATMVGIRKSLALTAQDSIDELRSELWGAELEAAIAQSILRLPPASAGQRRPKLSLAKPPAPVTAPGERTRITERLERALHVTTSARKQGLRVPASGPATAAPHSTRDDRASNGHHPGDV
ncbi:MAG: hypothetical protein M3016_05605 [Actinomycetota bacterium]|nr:hypothetical protein [Actinomycetota bacterium]